MTVGLIGFGRLGMLLTRYFAADFKISVFDPKAKGAQIKKLGAKPATLAAACAQDAVLLCVPIGRFESLVRRIRGLLRKDALVIDVCSVKEHPVRVMKRYLPRSVEILAMHPNFGPDSAAVTLKGQKLVVCKVRVKDSRYRKFLGVLKSKGLEIVEMSPAEHDQKAAASLVLTHFIGLALIAGGAKTTGLYTQGYNLLLRILETVQNDSWELFRDMNRYNAFAAPMRRKLLGAMRATDRRVRL